MTSQFDVIVVGGGIAGIGVAAELASDRRVLVLEQEAHPGMHATGRSAALYSETYGNRCIRELTRASREYLLTGAEGSSFATERGCLYVATEAQMDHLARFLAEPGVASSVERIEGAALYERLPVLTPDRVVAALFERHAFDLDVDAIHGEFLRRFRRLGGTLQCAARATRIEHVRGEWVVEAGGATYRAPIVVDAAGAWGDVVAGLAGAVPVGLEAMRRTALLVDPPQGIEPGDWPAVIDIDEQFYFKPEAGKILMSPADETPMAPCDAWPEELDVAIAIDRVQGIANIPVHRVSHSWAGLRTFAPDRTPVVGFDDAVPGFFWLVGQGGYGIQTSPALSRVAASLVRGEGIPKDLAMIGAADLAPHRLRAGSADQFSLTDTHRASARSTI